MRTDLAAPGRQPWGFSFLHSKRRPRLSLGAAADRRRDANTEKRCGNCRRCGNQNRWLRIFFDDGFPQLLGKASARKRAPAFPQFPQRRRLYTYKRKKTGTIFQRKGTLMVAMEIRKKRGFPQPQGTANRHNVSFTPSRISNSATIIVPGW
jgi:hypothetical protein